MTRCRELEERLSLYVDDLLDAHDTAEVRAHLESCDACAGLAADLARIASTARTLGPLDPPAWLLDRIASDMPGGRPDGAGDSGRSPRFRWWAAAAAAVLMVVSLAWMAGRFGGNTTLDRAHDAASSETGFAAVATELDLAVHHYERAIAELEAMASADRQALDPELARAVRVSLDALDRAIAESRAALTADPASEPARVSLFEALRLKVDVLQSTVLIGNESGGYRSAEPDRPTSTETEL